MHDFQSCSIGVTHDFRSCRFLYRVRYDFESYLSHQVISGHTISCRGRDLRSSTISRHADLRSDKIYSPARFRVMLDLKSYMIF